MLVDVVECLACPLCGKDLSLAGRTLRCETRHSFDVARQGYVNLLPGGAHAGTADTREMVEARDTFLKAHHFDSIATAVAGMATRVDMGPPSACVIDIGAGTGFYLARVLEQLTELNGLALDISKFAMRRAARAHPRIGAVVCDTWKTLPVRTGAASLLLNVFAPRNSAEFRRILAPGGSLIVVTPTTRHLRELVKVLGLLNVDEDKEAVLERTLGPHFNCVETVEYEATVSLSHRDIALLAAMGPSAWHLDAMALEERIRRLSEPVGVTVSVTIAAYRGR